VAVLRRVTVHTMSGRRTSGSPFQCRRSSMSRPSPSPGSVWKPTKRTHRAVRSCPVWCRAWCPVPTAATRSTDIDAIECPHDLLLSLSRFRCLAPARRTALPQPPDPPRSSRSGRMDRDRQAARRARPDPERARPPAGGRPPHRSDKASRRWASARSRSSAKEHRAPPHRLPRRPSVAR
jgi:hypothetical protein